MKFDIVTLGSAVLDIFIDTDLAEKNKHITYPVGSKILIQNLRYDIGGGGTNTAVAFSRLGFKTGYIGKIGDDDAGREILALLKKEKVKFLGKIEKNQESGASIILDSKENNRTILTYKGVNDNLKFSEIKKFKTKWLYLSSMLGKSFETQKKLAALLSKRGAKIAFNPSSYLIERKNLKSLLALTEVLILNKEEAQLLFKKKIDILHGLKKQNLKVVVITDKNKPIKAYDIEEKKKYSMKPHKIKVVERTGAGDAFASGFVAAYIKGRTIPYCLHLGLKESESVIRYFGAKNKLLRMKIK